MVTLAPQKTGMKLQRDAESFANRRTGGKKTISTAQFLTMLSDIVEDKEGAEERAMPLITGKISVEPYKPLSEEDNRKVLQEIMKYAGAFPDLEIDLDTLRGRGAHTF